MILQVFTKNLAAQAFYRSTSATHLGPGDFAIGGRRYDVEVFAYDLPAECEVELRIEDGDR